MSTTLATTTITRTRRTTSIRRREAVARPASGTVPAEREPTPLTGQRPASELTRIVFCIILGIAACLAVIGVVDQASTTSPDDPPPPVIVDFD